MSKHGLDYKCIYDVGIYTYPTSPPARRLRTMTDLLCKLYLACPATFYFIRPRWAYLQRYQMLLPIQGREHYDAEGKQTRDGWFKYHVYRSLN